MALPLPVGPARVAMTSLYSVGPLFTRARGCLLFAGWLSLPAIALAQSGRPPVAPAPPRDAAPATELSDDVPAHIAIVDGTALLERDGASDRAVENAALLSGDRLKTQA